MFGVCAHAAVLAVNNRRSMMQYFFTIYLFFGCRRLIGVFILDSFLAAVFIETLRFIVDLIVLFLLI